MKLYALSDIQISPDRQRQEFEAQSLEELKTSIETRGLMHPIVIREKEDGIWLVAGERRLRAISDLYALDEVFRCGGQFIPHGDVPCLTLGELDPLEAEEAELDENLRRKDLTWKELASAHARLHRLRQQQAIARNDLVMLDNVPAGAEAFPRPNHTIADTAKEIHGRSDGAFQDNVRKEVIISKHLSNPEVAKAKSLDEAWKVLKRSEAAEANRELAAKVGATFTADLHKVFNGNCLSVMDDLIMQDQQFDVILTDPPYGMDADQFGNGGKDLPDHQYKDNYPDWKVLMEAWANRSFLIAKAQAHAYVFCDIDRFHELKKYMQEAGWYVFRTPLIDYKTDSGRVPLPDRGPRRQWEMILYAIKGDKPVTHIYPDVIPCQADENMTHGAQKPVALYVNLLKRSVKPGDSILDTFAGSGTIFPAAHSLQCTATGIEQEANYYGMCLKRLQALKEVTDPLAGLV